MENKKKNIVGRLLKTMLGFYPVMLPATIACIVFNAVVSSIPSVFMQNIIAVIENNWQEGDWGAVGGQIRNFYIFFPLSYIFDDLIFRRHQRHSRGSVVREQNVRAPGIIGVGSPHPVSPDVLEYGISGNTTEHRIGIAETFRFSIFFQSFQQIFFWRQHIIFPFLLLS